ncbi:MAG: ribonuclease HII [Candidatus Hinthialibacter antarcticus]|nr:ribonuclease HII [Candidatus Hinthialibacter antarcticus]
MIDPKYDIEHALHERKAGLIAGVDEAGRGPLAGPVVAAVVILSNDSDYSAFAGINDSKQLSESTREQMYERIIQHAYAYSVAQASPREIDAINIRRASLLAMKRAVEKLPKPPGYVLVDGRDYPEITLSGEAVIKGDARCLCVGAASIIAKVVRDRIMVALDREHPAYGFAQHKGYPTEYHRAAVQIFGACKEHRTKYGPVQENLLACDPTPAFQSFMKQVAPCKQIDALMAIGNQIEASRLDTIEASYLQQRCKYRLEALKQASKKISTLRKGKRGENVAARLLEDNGYAIWERNYKIRGGEIDLIVNRGMLIVFVEVKTRTSDKFGAPLESITKRKAQTMIRTAERYLFDRDLLHGWDIRYDVISVYTPKGEAPQIEHIEDAFRVEEELR